MTIEQSAPPLAVVRNAAPNQFRKHGLGYVFEPAGRGVKITIDYVGRSGDDLKGLVLIETLGDAMPGVPRHLHQANFTFTSTTVRRTLITEMNKRTDGVGLKWDDIIESLCASVIRDAMRGNPVKKIGGIDYGPEPPDLIERILPASMATQLFAPGKTGKGWLAMGMAVAVATGTSFAGLRAQHGVPLYLDWEDNEKRSSQRADMVARGMGLGTVQMLYRSEMMPLRRSVNELSHIIDGEGVTFMVIDSAQKAIGSGGEFQSYEMGAAQMFEAIRMLGDQLTILLIDHVNKTDARGSDRPSQAYGSVMKTNWARNIWEVRKDQEPGAKTSMLGLYHQDSNHSEQHKPVAIMLDFRTPGEVHLTQGNLGESDRLSKPFGGAEKLADRCAWALRKGALHLSEIAERADATQGSVRTTMNREPARFVHLPGNRFELGNQIKLVPTEDFAPDDIPFFEPDYDQ